MNCHICGHTTTLFATAKVLDRYLVSYYQCSVCGFVQTEEPYWLAEAYADPINATDIGIVTRNLTQRKVTLSLLALFFRGNGPFVDYGGGYGLFVRLMRDRGYDFFRYDIFCDNLFARGFDAVLPATPRFELATSFEVFEHFVEPLVEIEKVLQFSSNILFSTNLLPAANPGPGDWWYYGLEHGQHVSIFTPQALQQIAIRFGLNIVSNGSSYHLLTTKTIPKRVFTLLTSTKMANVANLLMRRPSLLSHDYAMFLQEHGPAPTET